MARVEPHAAELGDQDRGSLGRPQTRAVSQRLGPLLQAALDPAQIGVCEARLAARPAGLLEPRGAGLKQLSRPTIHGLAMDPDLAGHLGLGQALLEELCGPKATPLQCFKVSCDSRWISHAGDTSTAQGNCHYIL